jgi:hypothetical protein
MATAIATCEPLEGAIRNAVGFGLAVAAARGASAMACEAAIADIGCRGRHARAWANAAITIPETIAAAVINLFSVKYPLLLEISVPTGVVL